MREWTTPALSLATAIIGVAIFAVIVSKKSNTVAVVQSFASAFNSILQTALSPITGGSNGGN